MHLEFTAMQRVRCAFAVVCLLASMLPQGAPAAEEEGWTTLFDGSSLDGWRNARAPRAENKWSIEDGAMTNVDHGNDIATVKRFKDFDLRIEFKTVPGGNSGVYLRGRIEVQVLDSYGKEPFTKQDNGAIYDQFAPLANASRPAGEWNQMEATIIGDEITVRLNGVLIHDKQKLSEVTGGALPGKLCDAGPILLQGDHGKVWYRNIMIREVTEDCPPKAMCPNAAQKSSACAAAR